MRAVLLCLALALGASATLADGHPRAASTTLCADEYLLALAERERIASVSWMATGDYAFDPEAAAGLPANRGSVEELIAADAELVVLTRGADPQTARVLDAFGIEAVELPVANDFDAIAENVMTLARALGREIRGEHVVDAMRARLEALAPAPDALRPRVVYYRPGGGGAGAGTFVDAVLTAAGYVNVQAERGDTGWGGLPAEALALDPPDGIVVSYFDADRASVASVLGRNPLLDDLAASRPVITVPGAYWSCAHPRLVEAVALLAAAREERFARSAP